MSEEAPIDPWRTPAGLPRLAEGEVHVWRTPVLSSPEQAAALEATLIDEERRRADRFRIEADRTRYIVSQGLIRAALGAYLRLSPESVPIVYGHRGKPALGDIDAGRDLRFNVSHAHDLVLLALAEGSEVGVDVEHIRPKRVDERLVRRFFSKGEGEQWFAYPAEERIEAFFRCWTRKEAYIKAKGDGLWLPLERFTVTLGEPARLEEVQWDPADAARWSLFDLAPGEGYAGALVVEGAPRRIYRWSGWAEEQESREG